MQMGLNQLFNNFIMAVEIFLAVVCFPPRIDRLMFVATKADHITRDQMPNLVSLIRQIVQGRSPCGIWKVIRLCIAAVHGLIRTREQVIVILFMKCDSPTRLECFVVLSKQSLASDFDPGTVPSNFLGMQAFWR